MKIVSNSTDLEDAADALITTISDAIEHVPHRRVLAVLVRAITSQAAKPWPIIGASGLAYDGDDMKAADEAADKLDVDPWAQLRDWAEEPNIVGIFRQMVITHAAAPAAKVPERIDLGQMIRDGGRPAAVSLRGESGLSDKLILRNQIAAFQGHPESMKSTLAAAAGLDYMRAGGFFVWMDWENGPEEAARKLYDLGRGVGLRDEELAQLLSARLSYRHMAGSQPDWDAAAEIAAEYPDAFWLWDSMRGIIRSQGGNEDLAKDTGRFTDPLEVFTLREDVAASAIIDHVTKQSNAGSRYARGSGDKFAAVQIVWYCEAPKGKKPTRTASGEIHLTNQKNRSGDLETFQAFKVGDGRGALTIGPASAESTAEGKREAQLIAYLQREHPAARSMKQIREDKHDDKRVVSGRTDAITATVERVAADPDKPVQEVDGGYVFVPPQPGT